MYGPPGTRRAPPTVAIRSRQGRAQPDGAVPPHATEGIGERPGHGAHRQPWPDGVRPGEQHMTGATSTRPGGQAWSKTAWRFRSRRRRHLSGLDLPSELAMPSELDLP